MPFAIPVAIALVMTVLVGIMSGASTSVASRVALGGRVFACFPIATAIARECVSDSARPTIWTAVFGALAFAAYFASGELGLRTLLGRSLREELAQDNVAAALVAASHFVALGLIASNSFAGSDARGLGLSLAFFALAVLTLHVGTMVFRAITLYDDAAQIRSGNVAAAISYAGLTIGMGVLVGSALDGEFEGWAVSLRGYATALLFAVAVWPVRQVVVQTLLLRGPLKLRGGILDEAVAGKRDVGAAALEALCYLGTGLLSAQA